MRLWDRQMRKKGSRKRLGPVNTRGDQAVLPPWEEPRRTVTSETHPNPHNYEVRLTGKQKQCPCPLATEYDPTTGKAEMLCKCDPPGGERAHYHGESEDADPFTMADDLRQPGSQLRRSRRLRGREPELRPVV